MLLTLLVGIVLLPEGFVAADRRATSTRPTADGTKALYLALEELGIPVRRRMTPLADVSPVDRSLALLAPTLPLTEYELDAVETRVRSGGFLLYVPPPPEVSLLRFGTLLERLGLALRPIPEEGAFALEGVTAEARPHRWTEGLDTVGGFNYYFRRSDTTEVTWTPLLTRGDRGRVIGAEMSLGDGTVLLLSDAGPLSNAHVLRSGAATIVARAAAERVSPADTLTFAEFHHGVRGGNTVAAVAGFLTGRPLGRALLHLGLVALLAVLVLGRRFGAPDRATPGRRRSPLEHVDALAHVYDAAGARRIPRLLLVGGLARHLGRPRPDDEDSAGRFLRVLTERGGPAGLAARRLDDILFDPARSLSEVADGVDRLLTELRR